MYESALFANIRRLAASVYQAVCPPRRSRRPRRLSAGPTLLVLLLAVVVFAPTGAKVRAASPSSQQPSAAEPAANSPFARQDAPPDDVRAVLGWGGGGAGDSGTRCFFQSGGELEMAAPFPRSGDVPCTVVVNDNVRFFVDNRYHESAEIRRPDGSILEQVPDEDGDPIWWIMLGAPTGRYTVTARQGARELSGAFLVSHRAADSQAGYPIARVWPRSGPPGTEFRVTLGGFDPGQLINLHLYRGVLTQSAVYQATVGSVQANERGEATYRLPSRVSDPEGTYGMVTTPGSRGAGYGDPRFELSGSPATERPIVSDEIPIDRRAAAIVLEANRTWASVVAKDGVPVRCLETVYGGDWLGRSQASVDAMRARGEYRVARMPSPPSVLQARIVQDEFNFLPKEIEVSVSERWDDRLFTADGSLARVNPSRTDWRYRLIREYPKGDFRDYESQCGRMSGWLITQAELLRED